MRTTTDRGLTARTTLIKIPRRLAHAMLDQMNRDHIATKGRNPGHLAAISSLTLAMEASAKTPDCATVLVLSESTGETSILLDAQCLATLRS